MTAPVRNQLGTTTTNRKWYCDVSTNGTTWTALMGMTEFVPNIDDATWQDDSDFDGGGAKSQNKTAFAWSATATVRRAPTQASATAYDPGQEIVRVAAVGKTGVENTIYVRFYEMEPGGPRVEAYSGRAGAQWSPNGGGMDANSTVGITLQGKGALSQITHPDA